MVLVFSLKELDYYIVTQNKLATCKVSVNTELGRIQDLVKEGSDLHPPTLSSCYCSSSPFVTRKTGSMVRYLRLFHFKGFDRTTRTTPGSAPAEFPKNTYTVKRPFSFGKR